jgi:hypothetical protein
MQRHSERCSLHLLRLPKVLAAVHASLRLHGYLRANGVSAGLSRRANYFVPDFRLYERVELMMASRTKVNNPVPTKPGVYLTRTSTSIFSPKK